MMAKLFRLRFARFLKFKTFFAIRPTDCQQINKISGSTDVKKRVAEFSVAAPDCKCEGERCSEFSSRPVNDTETLTRFIFSPVHISKNKTGLSAVKPSAFSYAETAGCSVQRDSIATNEELHLWMNAYKRSQPDHLLQGVLSAKCATVRDIKVDGKKRATGVYDTAEKLNPSHAEIFHTEHVLDEDRLEIRRELMAAFSSAHLIPPNIYRNGALTSS